MKITVKQPRGTKTYTDVSRFEESTEEVRLWFDPESRKPPLDIAESTIIGGKQ